MTATDEPGRTVPLDEQSLPTLARFRRFRVSVTGDGSLLGRHVLAADGSVDADADAYLHLAAVDRGVFPGPDGEMAMCTALAEEDVDHTIATMFEAIVETAAWVERR